MNNKMVFERRCSNFWIAAFIQHLFILLWWRHKRVVVEAPEDRDDATTQEYFCAEFKQAVEKIANDHGIRYAARIIFDETIWSLDEPTNRMNRCILNLCFSSLGSSYNFLLDFSKPIEQGVFLYSPYSPLSDRFSVPVNIFNVSFTEVEEWLSNIDLEK